MALRSRNDKQLSDQRILGDGEFVQAMWKEMDERGKENLRVNRQRLGLGELAERVCGGHGVSVNELRAGSRRHGVIRARGDFSKVAVNLLGHAGAEVARFLGVTGSCVTRVASQEGRLEDLRIPYRIRYARSARTFATSPFGRRFPQKPRLMVFIEHGVAICTSN